MNSRTMDNKELIIRYDGTHAIGMRQLGDSLIGFERMALSGLILIETGRFPKRRPKPNERVPFQVQASAPRQGSFEIQVLLESVYTYLPLVHDLILTNASSFLFHWIQGVLSRIRGQKEASNDHFSKASSLVESIDARRHIEQMKLLDLQELKSPAEHFVGPVGRSCNRIHIVTDDQKMEIDISYAEAIRLPDQMSPDIPAHIENSTKDIASDTSPLSLRETYIVKVDGFTRHNRQLTLVLDQYPNRIITGNVLDPTFEQFPNDYIEAAVVQGSLRVRARPILKDGRIQSLYIYEAEKIQ